MHRITHCLASAKFLSSATLSALVAFLLLFSLTQSPQSKKQSNPSQPFIGTIYTDTEFADSLHKFHDSIWNTLSTDEKIQCVQDIADMQAATLGLNHELHVSIESMPELLSGEYTYTEHTIYINSEKLDVPLDLLETLFHESYHAYQRRLCDAYDAIDDEYKNISIFATAKIYKEEFDNYQDDVTEFSQYYNQTCETHAREYAETHIEMARKEIDSYFNTTNSEPSNP